MVAGHAAQLLVNTFCSVPEDLLDASENESDGGDESDNDERNLMLGLLGREASLLVFPLFAVAAQHPLAAQVLVAEYVKAVRAAPQNMANLWALPCLFRRGLIMLNEVLDLAHIVIEAGGAPPQDVHLFLQILPSGAGAEANGNSATTIMHFLKACVTNPRIAASACVYPLFAYTLVHANCLLANDSMATPHKLFGIVDQDGLGLTAQLLCEVPNRLRPLPGADVFEHVLGYLLSQQKLQRKSSHIAEDEQALRRRLTRVAGLSSEHREFVCTALANVTRHPGDGSFPATAATETGWIQELLEKHGIDDLYDDMSTVHTGARGTSKRKRKGVAIAHENCRENNHYTRSKLPRELEINHIWPQTLNRQCLQKQNRTTTRGLKENNPLMPIISSSEDSISDDPNHNWESNTSRISINCTELEFGSSSDGDSGDLIPVRPPRVSKHSRQWQPRRRITLVMPPTSYSDESDPLLSSVPPEPSFFLVDTDSSDNTNSGDNNDDSDDDLLLLHHPSTNISAASRRRKIQSPEMPVSKRARLRCRAVHSASRSSSSLSNEGDDDDDDLLMT